MTNGEVTHLHGGVFGMGDATFIDFYWGDFAHQRFNSRSWFLLDPMPDPTESMLYANVGLMGSFTINRIPEPVSPALLAIGLAGLMVMRRRGR